LDFAFYAGSVASQVLPEISAPLVSIARAAGGTNGRFQALAVEATRAKIEDFMPY
jgi:hypothetical protein